MKQFIIQRQYMTDEDFKNKVATLINSYSSVSLTSEGKKYLFLKLRFADSTSSATIKEVVEKLITQAIYRKGYVSYRNFLTLLNKPNSGDVLTPSTGGSVLFTGRRVNRFSDFDSYLQDTPPANQTFYVFMGVSEIESVTEQTMKVAKGIVDKIAEIKRNYEAANSGNGGNDGGDVAYGFLPEDEPEETDSIQSFLKNNKELLIVAGALMMFVLIYKAL